MGSHRRRIFSLANLFLSMPDLDQGEMTANIQPSSSSSLAEKGGRLMGEGLSLPPLELNQ